MTFSAYLTLFSHKNIKPSFKVTDAYKIVSIFLFDSNIVLAFFKFKIACSFLDDLIQHKAN